MNQENNKNGIVSPFAPKIIQWLIKYSGGLIKNEKQANYVALGFIVLAIIVSIFLVFGGGAEQETFTPPPVTEGP